LVYFSVQQQCIGYDDYLAFDQIMKNKKYFKSKSNQISKN